VIDVAGPEDVSIFGIVDRFQAAMGRPVPVQRIPRPALRPMSVLARPFAPARAWQARAAVLMDGTDMAIRARPPYGVTGRTTIAEVVESAVRSADGNPLPEP
jgi:hypothetical protein